MMEGIVGFAAAPMPADRFSPGHGFACITIIRFHFGRFRSFSVAEGIKKEVQPPDQAVNRPYRGMPVVDLLVGLLEIFQGGSARSGFLDNGEQYIHQCFRLGAGPGIAGQSRYPPSIRLPIFTWGRLSMLA